MGCIGYIAFCFGCGMQCGILIVVFTVDFGGGLFAVEVDVLYCLLVVVSFA